MSDVSQVQFKDDLLKAADYLLLNAYSMNISGLYFGKSGISIVLFEIAEYLQNAWIEDHASEILNQSLLASTEKCDLRNGLAGIAFSLRYLINNEFVDADFNELFNVQQRKIEQNCLYKLEKKQCEKEAIVSLLFAFTASELAFKPDLLELAEGWLRNEIIQLSDGFEKMRSIVSFPIHIWLKRVSELMQLFYFSKQNNIVLLNNKELVSQFAEIYLSLCKKGLLKSDLRLLYFTCIVGDIDFARMQQIIKFPKFSITDTYLWEAYSFIERISRCQIERMILGKSHMKLNKSNNLIDSINKELLIIHNKASLYDGVGRLLLYYMSKNMDEKANNRINKLLLLPD